VKIAVVTWSARRVGGVESYLSLLPGLLQARGHQAAFWHETDGPQHRPVIDWEAGPVWSAASMGPALAVSALRGWRPDVVYTHGLTDPELESSVIEGQPAVFFGHGYYGTCISGTKTFMAPVPRPCTRRFGAACFLHYYPHRCGGLSPVTMVREFSRQAAREKRLPAYRAIATASDHMRREFERHGATRVQTIGLPVTAAGRLAEDTGRAQRAPAMILFAGRMESTKGGDLLLDTLPEVRRRLDRPLALTLLGDGPARAAWEQQATQLMLRDPAITVRFTGWVAEAERDAAYTSADVLVLPSVWPEPFGLVGLEAGARGVPTAAFAVGGIPEWLADGVNGHLAPGDPPTVAGLADALTRCLANAAHLAALRRGALAAAQPYNLDAHANRLLALLQSVA